MDASVLEGVMIGVWAVWFVALLIFYHTVFTVYYFDLGQGLMKELITAGVIAVMMAALTLYYWWAADILIVVFGIISSSKSGKKGHILLAVIFAVVVAIIGSYIRTNAG
jgi:hypothetical protein